MKLDGRSRILRRRKALPVPVGPVTSYEGRTRDGLSANQEPAREDESPHR